MLAIIVVHVPDHISEPANARAYVGSQLCRTELRADSILIERETGPLFDIAPDPFDRDGC